MESDWQLYTKGKETTYKQENNNVNIIRTIPAIRLAIPADEEPNVSIYESPSTGGGVNDKPLVSQNERVRISKGQASRIPRKFSTHSADPSDRPLRTSHEKGIFMFEERTRAHTKKKKKKRKKVKQ